MGAARSQGPMGQGKELFDGGEKKGRRVEPGAALGPEADEAEEEARVPAAPRRG